MRRVFFSFDWGNVWRANVIRNSWGTKDSHETSSFIDSAKIEQVKRSSDADIKRWIDEQLSNTSVTCVLIGSKTYESK